MNKRRFVRNPIDTYDYLSTSAKLIWHPAQRETYYDKCSNAYCLFRYHFELPDKRIGHSNFRLFADSRYVLYVNGSYVTKGPARSNPDYQFYDCVEVSSYLHSGQNVIAVLALHYGYGTGHSMHRIPAFFLDGNIVLEEGEEIAVKTGEGWVCHLPEAFLPNPPRVNGCKGPCQLFDNRKYEENWILPEYDDSTWIRCHQRDTNRVSPFRNLLKRPIPQLVEKSVKASGMIAMGVGVTVPQSDHAHMHLAIKQECTTMTLEYTEPQQLPQMFPKHKEQEFGVMCLDFGKVTAGYLNLEIDGEEGAVCDLIFAEARTADGRPFFDGVSYRPLSRFILREGKNVLQNFFNYDALRYVYIIYRGKYAAVREAWISAVEYPMERMSEFRTEDDKLQKLWDISVHTLKLCMLDGFLDSPSREQQQWMGDARWQANFNAYISGDMRMLRKILYQFAQSQDYEGMICSRYPDENYNWAPIPTFCLQWIGAFEDYYDFTGDLTPIRELYDHMIRAMRWFTAFSRKDGLIWDLPYWRYYDTGTNKQGRQGDFWGESAGGVENLMLLEAVAVMHRFAILLKDEEAAEFYGTYHEQLAKAIRNNLWSEEKGCMVDCIRAGKVQSSSVSEIVNILALLHLYEPDSKEAKSILSKVFDETGAFPELVYVDVYSMTILIRAMLRHGRGDLAYKLTCERFGEMLSDEMDATSTWESFQLYKRDSEGRIVYQNSACHGWGASAIVLVAEGLCGLKYSAGEPVLNEITMKDVMLPDFKVTLEIPGRDVEQGYRLECTMRNGKIERKLTKRNHTCK